MLTRDQVINGVTSEWSSARQIAGRAGVTYDPGTIFPCLGGLVAKRRILRRIRDQRRVEFRLPDVPRRVA
jgi:hypothetical protein